MPISAFRRSLEGAFRRRQPLDDLASQVEELLLASGIDWRRGWTASRLAPVLDGCRERSLGDAEVAALMACAWLEQGLGLDLVRRSLLAGDTRALDWLEPKSVHGPVDCPPGS